MPVVRIEVVPCFGGLWWKVVRPRPEFGIRCVHQCDAIAVGRLAARLTKAEGRRAHLIVRRRGGSVQFERSYPEEGSTS